MEIVNKKTNLHPLIRDRKSPVIFSDRQVEDHKLEEMWEAARWAPSSRNQQPWRFIYAKKGIHDGYEKIFSSLHEGNKTWAKNVPLFIVSIAETISTYKNKVNKYAIHDTGMAVMNLIIQATYMGLHAHQMGGYDPDLIKNLFTIPARFDPVAVIAIGYIGNINDFPRELQERELKQRVRNQVSGFVFENQWKNLE